NNEFILKATLDGRARCTWGDIIMGLIPLNLKHYQTQAVESVLVIAGFRGKENRENIQKKTKKIRKEIRQLIKYGFNVNETHFRVKMIWVSDLKSLWTLIRMDNTEFCPFCTCKKNERDKFRCWTTRTNLEMYFGIND